MLCRSRVGLTGQSTVGPGPSGQMVQDQTQGRLTKNEPDFFYKDLLTAWPAQARAHLKRVTHKRRAHAVQRGVHDRLGRSVGSAAPGPWWWAGAHGIG